MRGNATLAVGAVQVRAHHFCSHVNEEMRQCLIYDSGEANARLIGEGLAVGVSSLSNDHAATARIWPQWGGTARALLGIV